MAPKLEHCRSHQGPGWSRSVPVVLQGVAWVLLGLAVAPERAQAQQYYTESQQPVWQQRPGADQGVQQVAYTAAANGQARSSRRYASGQTPLLQDRRVAQRPRVRPVAQEMEEGVSTEAAPEEIYPEAAPDGGQYVDEGAPMDYGDGGASCGSCGGGGCGACCGPDYCDAPMWGPGEFFGCGPWLEADRLWVRADYLLWWTKGVDVAPLVTTSPLGTSQANAGRLDQSTTDVLFGDQTILNSSQSGGRISFGLRPTECTPWGIEATYFQLEGASANYHVQSDSNNLILARPFYSWGTSYGVSAARLVDFTGLSTNGAIDIEAKTQFRNVEVLFRRRLAETCTGSIDLLAGWRYDRLNDRLTISDSFTEVSSGNNIMEIDRFNTNNVFNGGELGIVADSRFCRFSFEGVLKLAFGNTRSEVELSGNTITTDPGVSVDTENYGLLVLPSNAGLQQRSQFGMIPELGLTVGYDLTCRLRATVGYSLVYWGKVTRAADQVNLDINRGQILTSAQGLPRPSQPFVTTDFWAQGLNLGLEYHF